MAAEDGVGGVSGHGISYSHTAINSKLKLWTGASHLTFFSRPLTISRTVAKHFWANPYYRLLYTITVFNYLSGIAWLWHFPKCVNVRCSELQTNTNNSISFYLIRFSGPICKISRMAALNIHDDICNSILWTDFRWGQMYTIVLQICNRSNGSIWMENDIQRWLLHIYSTRMDNLAISKPFIDT